MLRYLLPWLVASALTRVVLFLEPPGADQGLFMAEAELLRHGARFYSEVWEHKPVGTPLLYALAQVLCGRNYASIQLLNSAAALLSAVMLSALALRRGLSHAAACFAGLCYLAFHSGPVFGGFWAVAQAEVFLDPWLLGALLMLLPTAAEPANAGRCFFAGISLGVAVIAIKTSALPLVLVGLLAARGPGSVRRTLAFGLGVALVATLVGGYFAATGRASEFFAATVHFNLDHRELGAQPFFAAPFAHLFPGPRVLALFYVLGLFAFVSRATGKLRASAALDRWLAQSSVLWLLAICEVILQRKFWAYHYQVTLLPLSAIAALPPVAFCTTIRCTCPVLPSASATKNSC